MHLLVLKLVVTPLLEPLGVAVAFVAAALVALTIQAATLAALRR